MLAISVEIGSNKSKGFREQINSLRQTSSDNIGVPSNLSKQLRDTLLQCDPFDSDAYLKDIFADERLYFWQNQLKQADNRIRRVEGVINLLFNKYDEAGNNILVQLLHVLEERVAHGDKLRSRLANLGDELDHRIKNPGNKRFESRKQFIKMVSKAMEPPISGWIHVLPKPLKRTTLDAVKSLVSHIDDFI